MIAETASQTALMVAAYRARATRRPDPICRDPWAAGLAGAVGLELSVAFDRHFPHMELWIALRTRFLDDRVTRGIARGVDQVVILGAGFDTRAARLAGPGVRFFEVDHPSTQKEKRARLAELSGYPAQAAHHVACDFETDDFVDRLVAGGFATDRPAVVLWEGVTPYLTEGAVRATGSRIATALHPRSAVYFDYVGKRMAEGVKLKPKDEAARDEVSRMGEPIRWGTNDPLPLLQECGFRHQVTLSFDQICLSVTGTYQREREFRFQGICGASAGEPDLLC
jgi:methyltransferase (TIGR00027 family)